MGRSSLQGTPWHYEYLRKNVSDDNEKVHRESKRKRTRQQCVHFRMDPNNKSGYCAKLMTACVGASICEKHAFLSNNPQNMSAFGLSEIRTVSLFNKLPQSIQIAAYASILNKKKNKECCSSCGSKRWKINNYRIDGEICKYELTCSSCKKDTIYVDVESTEAINIFQRPDFAKTYNACFRKWLADLQRNNDVLFNEFLSNKKYFITDKTTSKKSTKSNSNIFVKPINKKQSGVENNKALFESELASIVDIEQFNKIHPEIIRQAHLVVLKKIKCPSCGYTHVRSKDYQHEELKAEHKVRCHHCKLYFTTYTSDEDAVKVLQDIKFQTRYEFLYQKTKNAKSNEKKFSKSNTKIIIDNIDYRKTIEMPNTSALKTTKKSKDYKGCDTMRVLITCEEDNNLAVLEASDIVYDDMAGLIVGKPYETGYWQCRKIEKIIAEKLIKEAFISGRVDLSEYMFKYVLSN